MLVVRLFLLILFMASYGKALSQNVLRYQINHVSQNEGLSSTYVRKIVEDPYGFIWAGTQDGLNRYDGRRNIIFNKDNRNNHTLSGSDIRDLIVDSLHHSIWVITSYGGIDGIDYGTASTWFQYDQQRDPEMRRLVFNCFFSFGGRIYIGSTAGIFMLEFSAGERPVLKPAATSIRLQQQAIDRVVLQEQLAWVFTRSGGVFVMDMEKEKVIGHTDSPEALFRTLDACVLKNGKVLVASTSGIQLLELAADNKIVLKSKLLNFLNGVLGQIVFSCFQEKSGRIWISDAKKVIRIDLSNNSYEQLSENTSLPPEDWIGSVYSIFIDRQDNLWLGCHQGLAFAKNNVSPFYRMYQSAASADRMEHLYYIDPKNDSITYAGGQNGLYLINNKTGVIRNITPGINYYHSFTDLKGNNIVSNDNGSFVIKNDQLIPLANYYKEFVGRQFIFNSNAWLNDSVVALGTRNFKGVIIWQPGKRILRVLDDRSSGGLSENVINALYVDKDRNLWVTGDHSITVFNRKLELIKGFSPFNPVSKKTYSLFFDVYDWGSLYYVASYGQGVIVLDKKFNVVRELTTNSGLSSNSTYKLLPYRDSLLFVTSNNGLSVFHLHEAGRQESYFESDGLQNNSFEENTGAVFNNRIYAGGTKGLSVVDPSQLGETRTAIPLFFDNLVVDLANGSKIDTMNVRPGYFKIPDNATQTRLTFSAPVFFQTGKIEYQYRVKELNELWIDLGNRNSISFIGLAPGKYTIDIRARYRTEGWPEQFITTTLIFLPKWFQTLAFKLAVLALIAAAIYLLYRFRITQLRKQEQIRKNIAIDLHDDIGSNLNSIKIFTHLAKKDQNPQSHLANIEESLTQTSAGLRDMIWILDDSKDTVEDLVARIKKFAHPLCLAKNIELSCTFESPNTEDLLTKPEKRNLLLIAKEVINNAIKYANCNRIELVLIVKAKRKKLLIKDNGDGFDPGVVSAGNGLKNIRHRAEQLKWQLVIESSREGTLVTIET
ncbi:MAG: hypothetical protein KA821_00640 [Chitinophagaceae bacterium]|nr:hypothetical protein [Chitinophagaceae bacterium]